MSASDGSNGDIDLLPKREAKGSVQHDGSTLGFTTNRLGHDQSPALPSHEIENLIGTIHTGLHDKHVRAVLADRDQSLCQFIETGRIRDNLAVIESDVPSDTAYSMLVWLPETRFGSALDSWRFS
jgi:hypothetical protein